MKNQGNARASLVAATMLSMMAAGAEVALPLRSAASGNGYRPTPPRLDSDLAREIAEHNAEVDRSKAEKRAAKMARRAA